MLTEIYRGTLVDNRYVIKKFLGQGGFGRTYLASDTRRFDESCVLKEFISTNSNPEILRRCQNFFQREARVLYQIEHPQIPKFKACFTEKERLFIVQEFIDGKTFSKILSERLAKTKQPFSETEVRSWLLELLPVIDYIHGQHIIHRDISLDNIMFSKQQNKPVLIDFGVVKEKFTQFFAVESSQQQMCGSVVGKIGYSPPEQLRMGYCYPCSDLYALGVCAIVLLTGKAPFMLIDSSLEWNWESYARLSDDLSRILRKMLAEKPTQRYQSAKEILLELQHYNSDINILPTTVQTNNLKSENQSHTIPEKYLEEKIISSDNKKGLRKDTQLNSQPEIKDTIADSQNFINYCQQELTSFVGPFAKILMQRTLESNPAIAPEKLVEVLSEAISQPEKAEALRNRLQNYLYRYSSPSQVQDNNNDESLNPVTTFSPKFIENCRRELTTFVGPFASIIIDDTLNGNPDLTPEELIENLILQIPDSERAENFKRRIRSFY
ncbi:serine/threonine-protein kinase [Mastigocoleus testarum]|uniref:non-specific serine/threonine protein kinase n=1 Tax=Mastigocoleus testarum BC008 TaxID=371196 RepID=A0A0V7ZNT4_9CYAN|nr:serine/threonine-protein kinase [Mastigocoleus testarum]KST66123.1 serine/threonine protein kinase [Mastigocoleus testarum BC008]